MANKFATELVGVKDGSVPRLRSSGIVVGGALTRFRATLALAASGNGQVQAADNVLLAELPPGYVFAFGALTVSATMGAAQLAVGTNPVHASNGQYRAAATATTADTPALFGKAAAQKLPASTAPTKVYLTTSADLPTAGDVVVDIFASSAR